MRLEFEPDVSAFPLVENEIFDAAGHPAVQEFDALLKNGIAAAQNGDRKHARTLLTNAAEAQPKREDAWMWLASISDYPEELLAFLDRVLDINPKNERAAQWRVATRSLLAKTFVQRAIAAHEQGSAGLAAGCLDQALAHDPDCEMAWFWKASISTTDDQKLECLDHVLRINPENQDAANAATAINRSRPHAAFADAKSEAVAGNREQALELVDEFLRSIPDNAEAWILRSHLSTSIGDKLQSLERALGIDPENTAARSGYDFLTATLGSKQEPAKTEDPVVIASRPTAESIRFDEAENCSPFDKKVEDHAAPKLGNVRFEDEIMVSADDEQFESSLSEPQVSGSVCPFCDSINDMQTFECRSCHATLTLSDIESLLSNHGANRDLVQQAVTRMEAEWNLREFDEEDLTALGIGHFNLGNLEPGLKYLQEASRLNANNVILSGQVNTIAIRLDEMSRQHEAHDSLPKGKTILVVDDSPTVRKLISGKLEKAGHNVVCAVNGVEALERIAEHVPDLVLLDIAMPRMDGYEVCKQIRLHPTAKDLPVVMISGKDGFFDKVRGRMAGTTGYVTKPFGPETLMKALEAYLLPETEHVN